MGKQAGTVLAICYYPATVKDRLTAHRQCDVQRHIVTLCAREAAHHCGAAGNVRIHPIAAPKMLQRGEVYKKNPYNTNHHNMELI